MIHHAKKFDRWLHSHIIILLALFLLILLRIPNFFEPYWYGDEGIYLTVGNAIKDHKRLYTDIVDHKTPIIYYLATVPNQFSFRFLNLIWMMVATSAIYATGKKIINTKIGLTASTFLFAILTTLPWFEGNIPNGELFVMGFTLVGLFIFSQTTYFTNFLSNKKTITKLDQPKYFYFSGFFLGLAVLTKVPAIMDVAAILSISWFALINKYQWLMFKRTVTKWKTLFKLTATILLIFIAGFLSPIIISIIYFWSQGSGHDYLQFGLLYNFRYAANWGLPFHNQILEKIFTLPGKTLILAFIYFLLSIKNKNYPPAYQLAISWLGLSLLGSLLSNRPYPHYFMQLIPALSILIGLLATTISQARIKNTIAIVTSAAMIFLSASALLLLNVKPNPTMKYYGRFYQLITKQISLLQYRQMFNDLMKDNYQAADIIKKSAVKEIFIWGTNPTLYALSQTYPTGKFTVSFHIKDFNAYEQTIASVRAKKPLFIIIMNDESQPLIGLQEYLDKNYILNTNFDNFSLWKRQAVPTNHLNVNSI